MILFPPSPVSLFRSSPALLPVGRANPVPPENTFPCRETRFTCRRRILPFRVLISNGGNIRWASLFGNIVLFSPTPETFGTKKGYYSHAPLVDPSPEIRRGMKPPQSLDARSPPSLFLPLGFPLPALFPSPPVSIPQSPPQNRP